MKPLVVAIVLALLTVACGDNGSSESSTSSAVITRTHKFQQGETLYELASEYLCDGARWPELVELNELPLRESGAVAPIPDGLLIKIPMEACATAPTSTLVLEAQATTVAPTTTAAPAATTTATPEEVALANLANVGRGALGDEYFIKNVRETMSVNDNNMYSDFELFDLARAICAGNIINGTGPHLEYLQGLHQTGPRGKFVTQFTLTFNAIFWYCKDYIIEFDAFAEKEGW